MTSINLTTAFGIYLLGCIICPILYGLFQGILEEHELDLIGYPGNGLILFAIALWPLILLVVIVYGLGGLLVLWLFRAGVALRKLYQHEPEDEHKL